MGKTPKKRRPSSSSSNSVDVDVNINAVTDGGSGVTIQGPVANLTVHESADVGSEPLNVRELQEGAAWRLGATVAAACAVVVGVATQIYSGWSRSTSDDPPPPALATIMSEAEQNFTALAGVVIDASTAMPEFFWDQRRPDETEAAFQERALNAFRDYLRHLEQVLSFEEAGARYSTNRFDALWVNLVTDGARSEQVKTIYTKFAGVRSAFSDLQRQLLHLAGLKLSDVARQARAVSVHKEKLFEARIQLVEAAGRFAFLSTNTDAVDRVRASLNFAGIPIELWPGSQGCAEASKVAASLQQGKAAVMRARLGEGQSATRRELKRRVSDPYLRFLRKMKGLPEELTEAEFRALQARTLDGSVRDPVELFKQAAFSYQESDVHGAAHYYERALALKATSSPSESDSVLTEPQRRYALASVDRLRHPDRYANALGVYLIKVEPGGAFELAGLKAGDVIVTADSEPVNEPLGLSQHLAQASESTVSISVLRKEEQLKVDVPAQKSGGAIGTQLVLLQAVQM